MSSDSWRRNSAAGDWHCGRFTAPRARPNKTCSRPIIEHCYRDFLLQNHDHEEREYPDTADQIREVLIHENYLSQKDIDICRGFNLTGIADRPEIDSIRTLHEVLKSEYGPEDEHGAS
jgi:hypothetical protein